jgi:hypothetical protein
LVKTLHRVEDNLFAVFSSLLFSFFWRLHMHVIITGKQVTYSKLCYIELPYTVQSVADENVTVIQNEIVIQINVDAKSCQNKLKKKCTGAL